jgi:hypothetical protein
MIEKVLIVGGGICSAASSVASSLSKLAPTRRMGDAPDTRCRPKGADQKDVRCGSTTDLKRGDKADRSSPWTARLAPEKIHHKKAQNTSFVLFVSLLCFFVVNLL